VSEGYAFGWLENWLRDRAAFHYVRLVLNIFTIAALIFNHKNQRFVTTDLLLFLLAQYSHGQHKPRTIADNQSMMT
jgi:hypothetical protein